MTTSEPAFAPFTTQHGVSVLLGAISIALILFLGRKGGKTEQWTRAFLAFVNLSANVLSAWSWSFVTRETDLSNALPFHLCDIAAITAGFALITGRKTLILLTYFWGLAGTVQGIATPAIDIGWPHPAFISFIVHHFAVIAAALYFPIVLGWRTERPWWKSPFKAFCWINIYVVVAMILNWRLGTNYGFLARKPENPSLLDHLGPHPYYIIVLEFLAFLLFSILTLPVMKGKSDA